MDDAAVPTAKAPAEERVSMAEEVPLLVNVRVDAVDAAQAEQIDTTAMADAMRLHLFESGYVATGEAMVPEGKLARRVELLVQVRFDLALEEGGSGALLLAGEAELRFLDPSKSPNSQVRLLIERGIESGSEQLVGDLVREATKVTGKQLAAELVARERLRRSSHEELLSALSVGLSDPGLVAWAIDLVAARQLKEGAAVVASRLGHEDEAVVSAAISALVSLGDPSQVEALTELADFGDEDTLLLVMEAVAAIGGEDAEAFLEYVHQGHKNPMIQARARLLLGRDAN